MPTRNPRPQRLTSAQAEVLELLWGQDWRNTPCTPEEVFPARDNVDNARRCTLRTLARAGLLEIVDPTNGGSQGRIVEHVDGIVQSFNDRGIHLSGENAWRNYSRYAGALPTPAQGQRVRLGLDGSGFVRELQVLDQPSSAEASAPAAWGPDTRTTVRLRVLEIAANTIGQFAQAREEVRTDHILPLATRLLAWVERGEAPSDD